MNIDIDAGTTTRAQLGEIVLRRALVATRRLTQAVTFTKIKLTEVFTRAGATDKQCRVEFTLGNRGVVIATARETDWRTAVDVALRRAARSLPGLSRRGRVLRPALRIR